MCASLRIVSLGIVSPVVTRTLPTSRSLIATSNKKLYGPSYFCHTPSGSLHEGLVAGHHAGGSRGQAPSRDARRLGISTVPTLGRLKRGPCRYIWD